MKKVLKFYQMVYKLVWSGDKFDRCLARKCSEILIQERAKITLQTEELGTIMTAFEIMHGNIRARERILNACWNDLSHIMTTSKAARFLFKEMMDEGSVKKRLYIKVIKNRQPEDGCGMFTIICSDAREFQRLLNAGRQGEEGYLEGSTEVIQIGPDVG